MQDEFERSGRCPWCGDDPLYVAYHDTEWGRPVHDPRALWEALMLEAFQAGLSWITILRRRETLRAAFAGFDPAAIATFAEGDIARLLADPGIIRHRGKIAATITGAQAYLRLQSQGGFAPFVWRHVGGHSLQPNRESMAQVPAHSPQAQALSKALKAEGFKFVGPTICYAFMQAVGMVNDHLIGCPQHGRVQAMAAVG